MSRRVEVVGSNGGGLEVADLTHGLALKEQLIFTGSSDWSPEQTEQYIDWRVQLVDSEIAKLRQQLEDLISFRKRWLAVTGGRSKLSGNGHNGHGNGGSSAGP